MDIDTLRSVIVIAACLLVAGSFIVAMYKPRMGDRPVSTKTSAVVITLTIIFFVIVVILASKLTM